MRKMLLPIVVVAAVFSRLQIAAAADSCDSPKDPKNGKVSYTSLELGSQLKFKCNNGYRLQDPETVYCAEDGEWSKTDVECVAITCGHPKDPDNGQVSVTSLNFRSQLRFECDEGYHLTLKRPVYCTMNGTWSKTNVRCVAKTCDLPQHPENGQVLFTTLTFGSQLTFKCDDGYHLQAMGPVYCTSDGTWNSTDVQCVDDFNEDRKESDSAHFEEKNSAAATEQPSEDLSDDVNLNVTNVNTGDDRDSGDYHNPTEDGESSESITKTYGEDEDVDYINTGNVRDLDDSDNTTKDLEPFESIVETTETDKDDITCGPPPNVEGTQNPQLDDPRPAVGTVVIYRCDFGYVNQDNSGFRSVCKLDKQSGKIEWTIPNVVCIPRSCGDPGFVSNANRIGNLFTFPNTVEFQCEEGYKLKGQRIRYCQASGTWSGRLPTCEKIYCNRPANPEHGRARYTSLEFGSELRYECDKGFILRHHKQRTCTEDGTWSSNGPVCVEASCEIPLRPEHGSVQLVGDPKVGSLAVFSCDDGRTMVGTSTSKCLITGQWTFPPPKCFRSCVLNAISNGSIGYLGTRRINRYYTQEQYIKFEVGKTFKPGETALFRCKDGFAPAGSSQSSEGSTRTEVVVTCDDGQWSQPLECKAESCFSEPLYMENGSPVVNNRSHGHIIYYKCKDHYVKIKDGKVQCSYGKWIGYTPMCIDGRCYTRELNSPGLEKPDEDSFTHGKEQKVTCMKGFRAPNIWSKISCFKGTWKIPGKACIEKDCSDDPPQLPHGKYQNHTRNHNSDVKYECDPGYVMRGYSTVQCLYGEWTGQPPNCVKKVSSNPSAPVSPEAVEHIAGQPDNCFCTFNSGDNYLTAVVNKVNLEDGGPVRKGATAQLYCADPDTHLYWPNGMRNVFAHLTCDVCETWESGKLPSCEITHPGDSFIVLDGTMKLHLGGAVDCWQGEKLEIACINWDNAYPDWTSWASQIPQKKYNFVKQDDHDRYESFIIIEALEQKYVGTYECSTRDRTHGHFLRPTKLELKIREPAISVPVGKKEISTGTSHNPTPYPTASTKPSSREDCSCTYNNPDRKLYAEANRVRLRYGDKVIKGDTTRLRCTDEAMHLILPNGTKIDSGSVLLTCNKCTAWKGSQLPTCEYNYVPESACGPSPICPMPNGTKIDSGSVLLTCNKCTAWEGSQLPTCEYNYVPANSEGTVSIQPKETLLGPSDDVRPDPASSKESKSVDENCYCTYKGRGLSATRINGERIWFANRVEKGEKVKLRCYEQQKYFVLTNGNTKEIEITCTECKTWENSDLPTCYTVRHPDKTCPQFVETEGMTVTYSNTNRIGSTARAKCTAPFVLLGLSTRQCLESGIWSQPWPKCLKPEVMCPAIHDTDDFAVSFSNGRKVNSTARFHCKVAGFAIASGLDTRTCLSSGEWSGYNPECIVPGCMIGYFTDNAPQNLVPNTEGVITDLQPVGSELPMLCEVGYLLIGDKKAKCGSLGKWEYGKAECVLGCLLNIEDKNSQLIIDPVKEIYRFGDFALLKCPDGLELTSEVERLMCLQNGWSDPIPNCREKKSV